jgi:predicted Zn-dependent peptidase
MPPVDACDLNSGVAGIPAIEKEGEGMRLSLCTLTIFATLALGAAPAAAQDMDVRRHSLDNGMTILTLEDHTLPVASFYIYYMVGSRNEQAGLTGISHFFEHMMFNGAKKYGPKEFDRVLETNGGYSNAYTSNDRTVYYEDFPSDKLEVILDLEADRMAYLEFDPEMIESERGVVMEERGFAVDNWLPGMMEEALFAAAFMAHPYHWPVIGWMSDIKNYRREDCLEYFETYYAPNNATVIIVGDIDTKKTVDLMERYFGDIAPGPPPTTVMSSEPEQQGERRVALSRPAQNEQFMAGFHVPGLESPDVFALDVAQVILTEGESSRLYKTLIYEEQVALSADADFTWKLDPTLYYFYVEMKPGIEASKGEELLYAELDEMKREPVSETELQKAKNILEAGFLRSLKTNNGRADQIGYYETAFGGYEAMFTVLEKYRAVTAEDIMRVMGAYFNRKNRTVVTLIPEGTNG